MLFLCPLAPYRIGALASATCPVLGGSSPSQFPNIETQIPFDSRKVFGKPFYKLIDELWETINQRNGIVPIQEGAYIGLTGIPFFNEEVIREVINNPYEQMHY